MNRFVWIAILFVTLQALLVLAALSPSAEFYVWYCNHILVLFSVFFFLKDVQALRGLVSVGLIPQAVWVVEICFYLLSGTFIFGFGEYFVDIDSFFLLVMTFVSHLFSSFLVLFFIWKEKVEEKSLFYSAVYIVFLYVASLVVSEPVDNANCVFGVCGLESVLVIPYHVYLWPIGVFVLVVLPTFFLQKYLSEK